MERGLQWEIRTVYRRRDPVDWIGGKSILRDTYWGSGRNGRERESTAGKQSDISLKSIVAYLSIKWLAMQRWNVLFFCWIESLRQFPTWQLPQIPLTSLSVFFSLYPIAPFSLFLWKLLATWQKYWFLSRGPWGWVA